MFGLVKFKTEKEKAEQHKCECHSNWCLKCLVAKELLEIKPVSGRILPSNATAWAMVKNMQRWRIMKITQYHPNLFISEDIR